jgi:hypothetical protein
MSKRAWAFAILIGTFALIGGQFRCSGGTGVVPVGAVTVNPSAPTIGIGATEAFKASVYNPLGTVGTVSWSIKEGAAGGSITQQGVYTAPTTPGSYTVVASFSSSPVEPGQATVNVVAPDEITVSVSPPSANLFAQNPNVNIYPGGSQLFTATVTGTPNTQVNWSIDQVPPNNPGLGWVTPGGLFTAGVYSGLYYVRATPVSDNFPNPGGYAVVNVTYPSRLNVTLAAAPNSAIVTTGGTQTFTATVNGTASTAVNWLVSEGDVGGIISAAGVYTAPATVGVYHVLAISQADPTQSSPPRANNKETLQFDE